MQTSLPNLLALTLGTWLTLQGPVMAQNLQINPGQQAVAAPAGPATAVAPAQNVAAETTVATTSTTTVATQMDLLPARTVLGPMLQNFNGLPGFGGRSRCGHVIDMLMQQHLHAQFFGDSGQNLQQPASIVGFDQFGRPIVNRLGDLRLLDVEMIADATPEMGPLYEVTLLNDSVRPAEDFRVSLVAVHGGILPNSPTVTMNIDQIAAGGTATLQVQMPPQCLAIAITGQAPAPFNMLVVAIDSFDELMEGNELNNVAVLERSDILIEGTTTETALTTEAVEAAPATPVAPAEQIEAAPVETAPAANPPGENDAPDANTPSAPADKLDLDNLDLDDEGDDDTDAETSFFIK